MKQKNDKKLTYHTFKMTQYINLINFCFVKLNLIINIYRMIGEDIKYLIERCFEFRKYAFALKKV